VGYDLHITRADHWPDHAMYPISLTEWVAVAVVAQKLGARLVGDDSEEYHADGSYTPWSAPRAILLDRPLR
jgi:hypothetical protein